MNVKQLREWLKQFPDNTTVEVVVHTSGLGYYDQGGNATTEIFEPPCDERYSPLFEFIGCNGVHTLLLGGLNE